MKIFCYHCRTKGIMTELIRTEKGWYCQKCDKEKEVVR